MQDYILHDNQKLNYIIIYRRRKTIGISVSSGEGLRISAPKWVSKKQIQEVIQQKISWILKKLSELAEVEDRLNNREFVDGSNFLYLGTEIILKISEKPFLKAIRTELIEDNVIMEVPLNLLQEDREQKIKAAILLFYRKQAEKLIKERVAYYSKETGIRPSRVVVKQQKKRWGSCSSKGNININWRLIMLPMEVLDYVIVHELAHLKVLNHSKDFWAVVETILPDYKKRSKMLKEYGKKLDF